MRKYITYLDRLKFLKNNTHKAITQSRHNVQFNFAMVVPRTIVVNVDDGGVQLYVALIGQFKRDSSMLPTLIQLPLRIEGQGVVYYT